MTATAKTNNSSGKRVIRCAVYTRKSSDEGLEQDFNSLHAQREACEAYIASQRHEGWKLVATAYDDGGYSGGSMERPGLQRLLADIQSGLVDVVVVYKVDRLTRSLTDFARIVESFDARGVSFVSVTQSFNTTSSMGRLTLNVLLSFAQFEREVTGERIRDKIAASKRKGLWMGGIPPMGYAANGRTLDIVEEEASIIRRIFARYLAIGSIRCVKQELDHTRTTTRIRTSGTNRQWGGKSFTGGHLRAILKNPVYIGAIVHKGERHVGQHVAIIEPETFDQVQARLKLTSRSHRIRLGAEHPNILAGLIVDSDGNKLHSSHANKTGRRYRYYISRPGATDPIRIPAGEMEELVITELTAKLADTAWVHHNLVGDDASPSEIGKSVAWTTTIGDRLSSDDHELQCETLQEIIDRIDIAPDQIEIVLKSDLMAANRVNQEAENQATPEDFASAAIMLPNPFARADRDLHAIMPGTASLPSTSKASKPPKWLLKAIARGVTWYDDLVSGRARSMRDLATLENVDERFVAQSIRFAFIDPSKLAAMLDGNAIIRIEGHHTVHSLDIPMLWADQI